VRLLISPAVSARIQECGGFLFGWPRRSRGPRLVLTSLDCSLDPPPDALDFTRVELEKFTIFLHPTIRSLPDELWVEVDTRHS
jgi:hypothetical protein